MACTSRSLEQAARLRDEADAAGQDAVGQYSNGKQSFWQFQRGNTSTERGSDGEVRLCCHSSRSPWWRCVGKQTEVRGAVDRSTVVTAVAAPLIDQFSEASNLAKPLTTVVLAAWNSTGGFKAREQPLVGKLVFLTLIPSIFSPVSCSPTKYLWITVVNDAN